MGSQLTIAYMSYSVNDGIIKIEAENKRACFKKCQELIVGDNKNYASFWFENDEKNAVIVERRRK